MTVKEKERLANLEETVKELRVKYDSLWQKYQRLSNAVEAMQADLEMRP